MKYPKHPMLFALAAAVLFMVFAGTASAETPFEGRKKCSNCHKSEAVSWIMPAYAISLDSRKADSNKESKDAMLQA